MKKFAKKHSEILVVVFLLFVWRIYFLAIQMNRGRVPVRRGFLGFIRVANFDGVYYLRLAESAYHGYDQAFFPLFPFAINIVTRFGFDTISAALIVVAGSFCGFLYILAKLVKVDYHKNEYIWILLFFLSFPTSFFLGTIYTESFFLLLTLASFYFARRGKFFTASVFGGLASATRVIGIFILPSLIYEIFEQQKQKKKKNTSQYFKLILIPAGLMGYMTYLWYKYGDPLLFVHQQPLFGAGRSGGKLIFLPQVIYRYIKIFLTLPHSDLIFWISLIEFTTLLIGCGILILAYKKGIRKSYILFSACALLFPTLSGTLSSLPRYALAAFAIFIYLGLLKNIYLKIVLIVAGLIVESIFAIFFLQGYFIA